MIPAILARYAIQLGGAFVFLAIIYAYGNHQGRAHAQKIWDAEKVRIANKIAEVKQKQDAVSVRSEAQSQQVQEVIKTVFRDRIVLKYKEVPHEIIVRQDTGCTIPNRFISLWNSANRASLPDPTALIDETPSGVVLSDVEFQKDRESELCHANTEQLKSLQTWVINQQTATK